VYPRLAHPCDDVLDLLAAGQSHAQIVEELPDLEIEDIKAAFAFGGEV
jgi:uncharacterized protein (DUF433 family)